MLLTGSLERLAISTLTPSHLNQQYIGLTVTGNQDLYSVLDIHSSVCTRGMSLPTSIEEDIPSKPVCRVISPFNGETGD